METLYKSREGKKHVQVGWGWEMIPGGAVIEGWVSQLQERPRSRDAHLSGFRGSQQGRDFLGRC